MKKLNNFGKGCLKLVGATILATAGGNIASSIVKTAPTPMGKTAAFIGVNVLYTPVLVGAMYLGNRAVEQICDVPSNFIKH